MKLKIYFKGRAITAGDLETLSRCFGEKIDDMKLCQAVILRVMQSRSALARGAVTRALDTGRVGPGEGGRVVRHIIRRARRDLGYSYDWHEHLDRFRVRFSRANIVYVVALLWHDARAVLRAVFGSGARHG